MRPIRSALMVPFLGIFGLCFAGPFNQKEVPSSAVWVVHVDFEQFRDSQIGRLITAEIMAKHQEKIDSLKVLLGSNLMTDLASITLYGSDSQEENAVSLIRGRYDKEKLLAFLKLNPKYSETAKEGYTLYSWIDENRQKDQVGTFVTDDLIVISQNPAVLQSAMEVLAGKEASLANAAEKPLLSLTKAPEGAFLLAAAEKLSNLAGQEHAAILKNSNFMVFITSEQAGNLAAHLKLESETDESALQIEQVVRGMLAFMTLQLKEQPSVQKLLQSSVISRNGRMLEFDFSVPSAELFEMIKSQSQLNLNLHSGQTEPKES